MRSDREYARQLIEFALKNDPTDPNALWGDTLYGAVQHVYLMARDRKLPWARPEVEAVAYDAVRYAETAWLAGRTTNPGIKSARAVLEAAQREGFDLRAIALKYLQETASERSC